MNIGSITQQVQTIAVYKEIESSRLMEAKELEDIDIIKHIDDVQEFNDTISIATTASNSSITKIHFNSVRETLV